MSGIRTWTTRMVAGVGAATLALVACSSPQDADAEPAPVTVTAASAPAAVDVTTLGWENTEPLASFASLAADTEGCELEVVAAARSVLGVRCATAEGARVVYSDVAADQTVAAADLLSPDGQARLLAGLGAAGVSAAAGDGAGDTTGVVGLDDLRFDASGNLVVVAPDASAWQISADQVDPLLSDAGRLVRGAQRAAAGFTGAAGADAVGGAVVLAAAAQLPPAAPAPGGYNADADCAVDKCIAITYDDGPGGFTGQLLDILDRKQVPATFFVVGRMAKAYPDTLASIAERGHEIGGHTWNHPDLRTVSADRIRQEMNDTAAAIEAATGQHPVIMRPPYGATNDSARAVLAELGYGIINWDVDTEDWKNKSASETTKRALAGAHRNSIILMHDIHASTIEATPGIIDQLKAQGYTLVTVEQLLGTANPGQVYYSGN